MFLVVTATAMGMLALNAAAIDALVMGLVPPKSSLDGWRFFEMSDSRSDGVSCSLCKWSFLWSASNMPEDSDLEICLVMRRLCLRGWIFLDLCSKRDAEWDSWKRNFRIIQKTWKKSNRESTLNVWCGLSVDKATSHKNHSWWEWIGKGTCHKVILASMGENEEAISIDVVQSTILDSMFAFSPSPPWHRVPSSRPRSSETSCSRTHRWRWVLPRGAQWSDWFLVVVLQVLLLPCLEVWSILPEMRTFRHEEQEQNFPFCTNWFLCRLFK